MEGIISELRKFIINSADNPNKNELYINYGDSKISYIHAEHIVEVCDGLRLTVKSLQEKYNLCKDYNRLLRNENKQLRKNK